jgi:hypothetical protein
VTSPHRHWAWPKGCVRWRDVERVSRRQLMNSVTSATKHLRSITDTHLLVYMRRSLRARRPPPSPKGRLTGYSDHHPSLPSSTGSTTTDGTSGSSGHWYVDAARALAETKSDVYGDIVAFNNAHPEEYVCRLHTAATFAVLNPPDCTDSRLTSLVHVHAIEALTRMCPISVCVVLPFEDKQTNMRSSDNASHCSSSVSQICLTTRKNNRIWLSSWVRYDPTVLLLEVERRRQMRMIDVFRALDKDSSGGITAEELVASELGAALSPVQVTCLLQCAPPPPVTHKHTHTRAHTQAQK